MFTDVQLKWIAHLSADAEAQQKANRIKKRKMRGLRKEVARLRKALEEIKRKTLKPGSRDIFELAYDALEARMLTVMSEQQLNPDD